MSLPPRSGLFLLALLPPLLASVSCGPAGTAEGFATAPPTPAEGGVFRLLQGVAPSSLDPVDSGSVYEALVVSQLFDGLVASDPATGIRPALAESWTLSPCGRTYTFRLRSDVVFHDGRPLRADDVVFTLRRLLGPPHVQRNIAAPYLQAIAGAGELARGTTSDLPGVEAVGPLGVRIRLERPSRSFLEALALPNAAVVPRHVVEDCGAEEFARHPVGTGAFRLRHFGRDAILLERNPDYFDGPAHLDEVRLLLSDASEKRTGAERFQAGELDILLRPEDDEPGRAALDRPDVKVLRFPGLNLQYLGVSNEIPPLDDPRVRQAIAHAVDRRPLAGPGSERRIAGGVLPPGMSGYSPLPKTLPYDPARARDLLAQAGHRGGAGLPPLVLFTAGYGASERLPADQVCSDLEALGIRVEIRVVGWRRLLEVLREHAAPLYLLGWAADMPDEDPFLRPFLVRDGAANHAGFEDPDVTALLERAAAEMDPEGRAHLVRALEQRSLEAVPMVPLFHTNGVLLADARVEGVRFGTLGLSSVAFKDVWLRHDGGVR